ncbi:UBX domain-containing protein 1 isoform X2 [Hyalella azteca]|nr:UBX domain-containing protein 1 isoform X2 [Hyalella azteca]
MEWLLAHADDPALQESVAGTDDNTNPATPSAAASGDEAEGSTPMETGEDKKTSEEDAAAAAEAKSIRCDDCGKLFKTPEEVEFHAVKSGHSSFSESTEEKAPLTEEQKKQKLLELEEKMKARRKAKAEEEAREEREREKKRIEMGKNVAEHRRKLEEDEIRKLAEEKRREKLEDKLARQRVKEQIEADKEARRQKLAAATGAAPVVAAAAPPPAAAPPAAPKKSYDETRIQFRLPSGPPVVQTFKAKEPLSAVKLWVTINHPCPDPSLTVSLSTTFPRQVFSEDQMVQPLESLGLVPSSVLMVQYK